MYFRKEWVMEKGNWEFWGVYSRGEFEFEIGVGNLYVREERKEKISYIYRVLRVRVEIVMGKGVGRFTWVFFY